MRIYLIHKNDENKYYINCGKYFGYPECCINEFLSFGGELDDNQEDVVGTGFVPCKQHAKEIVEGKTTLEALIKDRECKIPFPEGTVDREQFYSHVLEGIVPIGYYDLESEEELWYDCTGNLDDVESRFVFYPEFKNTPIEQAFRTNNPL